MALGIDIDQTTKKTANQTLVTPTAPQLPPSLPPPLSSSNDHHSSIDYITFLVNRTDTIIADKNAILSSNTDLCRIVSETTPINGYYSITGINTVDFEGIVKFIETKFIKFDDIDDALHKLDGAKRFHCSTLVRKCVTEIDQRLTATNVLKVFRLARYYVVSATPSKKSIDSKTPEECLESLLYNVFQFIDAEADIVLQRDEILELSFSEIEMILRRDCLMTSETVLFNLIANWSRVECQRRQLDLTSENRRRVLGSLCYIPRYLRMTAKEFDATLQRIDILDPEEVQLIHAAFKGKGNGGVATGGTVQLSQSNQCWTSEQKEMLANFRKIRPKYPRMPVHLSDRSNPKNYSRKMRKHEKTFDEESNNSCLYWFCGCYAFICD